MDTTQGWERIEALDWLDIAAALPLPWPEAAARQDLRYWAGQERLYVLSRGQRGVAARPGRPTLVQRWGWTDKRVRLLLADTSRWADQRHCEPAASTSPAMGQPRASRGPAEGQPRASRGPGKRWQVSGNTGTGGQPGASRGPAGGQPRASLEPQVHANTEGKTAPTYTDTDTDTTSPPTPRAGGLQDEAREVEGAPPQQEPPPAERLAEVLPHPALRVPPTWAPRPSRLPAGLSVGAVVEGVLDVLEDLHGYRPEPDLCRGDALLVLGRWRDEGRPTMPRLRSLVAAVTTYARLVDEGRQRQLDGEAGALWYPMRHGGWRMASLVLQPTAWASRVRQALEQLGAAGWGWDGAAWQRGAVGLAWSDGHLAEVMRRSAARLADQGLAVAAQRDLEVELGQVAGSIQLSGHVDQDVSRMVAAVRAARAAASREAAK